MAERDDDLDILGDGKLDLDEMVLDDLDWVVATIHDDRDRGKAKNTARLLAAFRSGVVHCIGHPMERLLGGREPRNRVLVERAGDAIPHAVKVTGRRRHGGKRTHLPARSPSCKAPVSRARGAAATRRHGAETLDESGILKLTGKGRSARRSRELPS